MRKLTRDVRPLQHRTIENWEYMEKLWEHTFVNELRVDSSEYPVLITEPHDKRHPAAARERTAKVMFETHGVPVLSTYVPAVLALYSSGRTTGAVLDSGLECSSAVAIYEGVMISNTARFSDIGGNNINAYLRKILLSERRLHFDTPSEGLMVEHMKRQVGRVALDFDKELHRPTRTFNHRRLEALRCLAAFRSASAPSYLQHCSYLRQRIFSFHEKYMRPIQPDGPSYKLPDGQVLKLQNLHFMCSEIIFDPSPLGLDDTGSGSMFMHTRTYIYYIDINKSH